jgi:hypothetical protein
LEQKSPASRGFSISGASPAPRLFVHLLHLFACDCEKRGKSERKPDPQRHDLWDVQAKPNLHPPRKKEWRE